MSGFLNNKTRIFDTVLTVEGRRQLAAGTFRISFGSFSDGGTFYQGDIASGSAEAGNRIALEAPTIRRDQITFETDDSGQLVPYATAGDNLEVTEEGRIISASIIFPNGANYASLATDILESSLENFQNLSLIGSTDIFLDVDEFGVSRNEVTFTLTDEVPLSLTEDVTETSVDNVESFYHDKRLSHIPNFKYLPPVNKDSDVTLGKFPCQGQPPILSFEQLMSELDGKENVAIEFSPTSRENNLVSQLFELSEGRMTKLDVIDFGEFIVDDFDNPIKQVFFVGKIYLDSFGQGTFVNQFVLVYE